MAPPGSWEGPGQALGAQGELLSEDGGALSLFRDAHASRVASVGSPDGGMLDGGGAGGRQKMKPRLGVGQARS